MAGRVVAMRLALALGLLAGCESGELLTGEADGGVAPPADVELGGDGDAASLPDSPSSPDVLAPDGFEDTKTVDANDCETGTGCFEDPCDGPDDCNSMICSQHIGERVCSKTCDEDCPDGWTCSLVSGRSDAQYVCTSNFSHLCLPCATAEGCSGETPNACVTYADGGSFCGGACDFDIPCPEGYACQEVETTTGEMSFQCMPDAGICSCSSVAIDLGLGSPCINENDIGSCEGMRVCSEEGLKDCNAPQASLEECNGVDDDCNGLIDDGTCDDENACTDDTCDATEGCIHTPLDAGECLDGDACTQADHCEAGQCVGAPLNCDDGNPCTDDGCDAENGCQTTLNFDDCDDGDACTLGDSCKDAACAPGPALDCDDGNVCTDDSCGPAGCIFTFNVQDCDDGNACTTSSLCAEGVCTATEQMLCDDENPCTSDACNPAIGCFATNHTLPCDDGNVCSLGDTCSDGACQPGAAELTCDDGNPCMDTSCDPASGCVYAPNALPCDDKNDCTVGDVCADGACGGEGSLACDDGNVCTVDSCLPNSGCAHNPAEGACDDGDVCSLGDTCSDGACQPGAAELTCDDGNPCMDTGCDPVSGCVYAPNALPCDDKNDCTVGDVCADGACGGEGSLACDDGNACTVDSCLPNGGCAHIPAEGACDDGDACTVGDTCVDGTCESGQAPSCDDGNICTDEACVEGDCVFTANAQSCDDGNACTLNEQCDGGACVGTEPVDCNDGDVCTTDFCDPVAGCQTTFNSAPCSDGNVCTTGDTCTDGSCVALGELPCEDGNPCTDDGCEALTGCSFDANDLPCDDQNACTLSDTCTNKACVGSSAPSCDDGDICTDDVCDPLEGCNHVANDAPCDDGDACTVGDTCGDGSCLAGETPLGCNDGQYCNGLESCDADWGCVAGLAPNIDDGVPCTQDACDEDADTATHTPTNANCDDGQYCNGAETCDADSGCVAGLAPSVDDGLPCTDDTCDEDVDAAVHTPINADCDDGQYCNGPESCDADWGCVAGLAPNIDDGLPCTEDACDEDGDTAVHTPINADCDDGQYCNGPETCDANAGCVAGLAPNIDDGIPCTVDTCDEDVDAAQHTPINADCDDDQYCNGAETCDANTGCVAGQAPNIDDGVACTDDSCDEDNDAILFVPNNGACPSGLCESPVCDANQGCTVNTVPNCCGNNIVEAGESCDDGNNVDGDGCDANCQSPCEYVNQFNVHSGPAWGSNPPTYTCQEACALLFGGSANEYSCSTNGSNPDSVNHKAYLSGWGDGQYCSNPQPDDWKKNTFYNCGNAGCAYSAYVSDHCSGTLPNYCFTGCN